MEIARTLRGRLRYTILGALAAGIVASLPLHAAASDQAPTVPTSTLGPVWAVGVTGGNAPVYVSTAHGLYRMVTPDGSQWSRQNSVSGIVAISPNPLQPDDLLYTTPGGTFRSTDGGRTAERVSACPYEALSRSSQNPNLVYGGSAIWEKCLPSVYGDPVAELARSLDDGITWTTVFTTVNGYDTSGGIGPIAINADDPRNAVMAYTIDRGVGYLATTTDGGQTWTKHNELYMGYANPGDIANDPHDPSHFWVAWGSAGLWRSADSGHTWTRVNIPGSKPAPTEDFNDTPADIIAVRVDPLTGRAYIAIRIFSSADRLGAHKMSLRIIAISVLGNIDTFDPGTDQVGNRLAVLASGYVLSWDAFDTYTWPYDLNKLYVHSLIGAESWGLSSIFPRSAKPVLSTLGQPISPTDRCDGVPCQYFVKGALAVGPNGVQPVALVPRLLSALVRLPVGGSTSTLTYATLMGLHSQRVPLPAGFHGGTMPLNGGVFVPYSATLRPASGYVVPPDFWRYLTDRHAAPNGWLRDVGLPLTPAASARVDKGRLGVRRIVVQAFQNAVLTYDPRNAAPFQVERANVGADYAAAFPQAVR